MLPVHLQPLASSRRPKEKKTGVKENVQEKEAIEKGASSNSGGYGYGRSATSTASVATKSTTTTALDALVMREDRWLLSDANRKSTIMNLFMFLLASFITFYLAWTYDDQGYENRTTMRFHTAYPSVTHNRVSISTDEIQCSHFILEIALDVGNSTHFHREAAVLHAYCFMIYLKRLVDMKDASYNASCPPSIHLSNDAFNETYQTSLFAWGFKAAEVMNTGPFIVHNNRIQNRNLNPTLQFSTLPNTSLYSQPLDYHATRERLLQHDDIHTVSGCTIQLKKEINTKQENGNIITERQFYYEKIVDNWNTDYQVEILKNTDMSHADPVVPLSSSDHYDTEEFGLLQFASSGPKTLGTIAEIAIQAALEYWNELASYRYKNQERKLDKVIVKTLIATLDLVAESPGYFENSTLNKTDVLRQVPFYMNTKNISRSLVKFHTSGALTANMMVLDEREGWPTVTHFSITADSIFRLEAKGKNSTEMLNICQVTVIRDGILWLTAAASGEFYLLEKVVASIVHKIVMNTDPLQTIYNKRAFHYDVYHQQIRFGRRSDNLLKESLQFAQYNILKNRFRSWVQPARENHHSPNSKWNIAIGF